MSKCLLLSICQVKPIQRWLPGGYPIYYPIYVNSFSSISYIRNSKIAGILTIFFFFFGWKFIEKLLKSSKKVENGQNEYLASFWVHTAPKSELKYTIYYRSIEQFQHNMY